MNSTFDTIPLPTHRGPRPPSSDAMASRWRAWGAAIWRVLESLGHARAQHELRMLADRWSTTHPRLAEQLRAAAAPTPPCTEEPR